MLRSVPYGSGMIEVLDNFLWTLRREGFAIAPPQAVDCARAASAVGFDDRSLLRDALACVLVSEPKERARFDAAFDAFFSVDRARSQKLLNRLKAQGFSEVELGALVGLLREFLTPQGGANFARFSRAAVGSTICFLSAKCSRS